MYFSNTNKLRKILSLILVCVLVGTLFAGCSKKDDVPETTPNTLPGLNLDPSETTNQPTTEAPTEPTEVKENMGTVTQQMNIRGTPSMQAAVLGTLYAGDRIEVVRRESVVGHVWGYIQTPAEGWVVMDYVEMDDPSDTGSIDSNDTPASNNPTTPTDNTDNSTTTQKGIVNGNGVNIRSEGSTSGKIQGSYNKGDVVTILEVKGEWGRTDKGWIKMSYVNLTDSTGNSNTNTGNNNNTNNNTDTGTDGNISGNGSTTVVAKGVVKVNELNLRASSTTDSDRLGILKYGTRVEIYEKSGSWGRTSKGWIHMDYIYQDGTTGSKTAGGIVTGTTLNIRSGPGTGYGTVGAYSEGDWVNILEQFTYGNVTWGCTKDGWISLDYVDLEGNSDNDDDSTSSTSRTGTVTTGLYIRSGPGTGYDVIGSYDEGDEVTVTRTQDGWGKTDEGWISLNYVDFSGSSTSYDEKGVVTATKLYVREGPGTDYQDVDVLYEGDEVTILSTKTVKGTVWGEISQGWICMDYVDTHG